MFIRVTVDKYYATNAKGEDDWKPNENGRERRVNVYDIHQYWGEGRFTILILKKQQYAPAVMACSNTVEEIDAMVAAVNPAAAKILFGKKDT